MTDDSIPVSAFLDGYRPNPALETPEAAFHPAHAAPLVVHLQADRPAHDRYRIIYRFAGGDSGEIIQPNEDEAWAMWNVVRAAHARGVR